MQLRNNSVRSARRERRTSSSQVLLFALAAVLIVILGITGYALMNSTPTPTTPQAKEIDVGRIGTLPSDSAAVKGPKLTVPALPIDVPGVFPLESVAKFQIPIRNVGTESVNIDKLDVG